jgi:hypothetical protein
MTRNSGHGGYWLRCDIIAAVMIWAQEPETIPVECIFPEAEDRVDAYLEETGNE